MNCGVGWIEYAWWVGTSQRNLMSFKEFPEFEWDVRNYPGEKECRERKVHQYYKWKPDMMFALKDTLTFHGGLVTFYMALWGLLHLTMFCEVCHGRQIILNHSIAYIFLSRVHRSSTWCPLVRLIPPPRVPSATNTSALVTLVSTLVSTYANWPPSFFLKKKKRQRRRSDAAISGKKIFEKKRNVQRVLWRLLTRHMKWM